MTNTRKPARLTTAKTCAKDPQQELLPPSLALFLSRCRLGRRSRPPRTHSHPATSTALSFKYCVCVLGGGERERERERDTDETYAASKQDSNAAHHLVRVPVRVPDVYLMRSSALNLAHLAHFLSGFFGCPGTQENLTTKYQVPSTKSYLFANSNGHLRLSMACSSTSTTLTPVVQ